MSDDNKNQPGYVESAKQVYNKQYDTWVPWIEDKYLSLFTKDNKASYATKDTLDKSKVTGVEQVDKLQDGVNGLVSGQVGKGGLLQPIGDMASKEGVNRMERGGKDDKGTYGGPAAGLTDPLVNNAKAGGSGVAQGASAAGSKVTEGAKGAGGYIGGLFGTGKK
ncbi:hypothetical protein BJ546DRAFT_1000011 [Cryomyces antarcticus]|uniref:Uncharacterized protein n=1 Tax=Cryomyces antarcticus TaxID=329879 RepID=A0ABR0M9D7_9PEZI|nr:hypothetical protein LTR39_000137 [Cryomyces antarcticus]KAK5020264.1 hypothetical protein LTR60_000680 [Cryomyces antarcticus]KAK5149445.1 hypothetical protein LTR04_007057 [Oleoguttula sp. CCFEE 6159]KAK5296684.1 hypothetical protein LTR16_000259 [Cryomyces antarcticus]